MATTAVYTIHDPPSERLHQRHLQGHPKVGWLDIRHTVSPGNVRDFDRQ